MSASLSDLPNAKAADIGILILAAGQSLRFGERKLTALLRGKPIWRWALDNADAADFGQKALVVGPNWPNEEYVGDWTYIVNPSPGEGMGSSIKLGIEALKHCRRVVIALADMPFVPAAYLAKLASDDGVIFTQYPDGKKGVPAAFPSDAFPALMALTHDQGASSVRFSNSKVIVPENPTFLWDIDTKSDLDTAGN